MNSLKHSNSAPDCLAENNSSASLTSNLIRSPSAKSFQIEEGKSTYARAGR
eukprot:m.106104 g.106104  ORF g.106104 m.106104 type:complete len:51 (-) comp51673_c0_seq8:120-272(-)